MNRKTFEIICIAQGTGRTHDFKLFKKSIKGINKDIKIQADSGYQGIGKIHKNSETPKKRRKKVPLTKEEKANNHRISQERILIENINCKLKVWKIMAEKYRNRRKRFNLRVSILCGIYNYELKSSLN